MTPSRVSRRHVYLEAIVDCVANIIMGAALVMVAVALIWAVAEGITIVAGWLDPLDWFAGAAVTGGLWALIGSADL